MEVVDVALVVVVVVVPVVVVGLAQPRVVDPHGACAGLGLVAQVLRRPIWRGEGAVCIEIDNDGPYPI